MQLCIFSVACLVSASHQLVLIMSLPFLQTAPRSYRLNDSVNNSEIELVSFAEDVFRMFTEPYHSEEGEIDIRFPQVNLRSR